MKLYPNYSEEVQYNLSVSCIIMQCFNNALTSKVWHYRSHSTIARSSVMSMIMSHTRTFHSFKKKKDKEISKDMYKRGGRERQRERDRETETEKDRDKDRDRQTGRQTDRQRGQTETETDRQYDRSKEVNCS